MSVYEELNSALYDNITPYSNVEVEKYKDNQYPHTHIDSGLVDILFSELKPTFVLEIGSMVGGSCIKMVESFKRLELNDSYIVCIDPFTGDVNMWDWEQSPSEYKFLRLENGIPTIYKRFLSNTYEYKEKIVPINCTSMTGINLIQRLRSQNRITSLPSIVYLDSAHCINETFMEIMECWQRVMPPNSILFGDDWIWNEVSHDVTKAAKSIEINTELRDKIQKRLTSESKVVDGILLYNNQWMLFKS